MDIIIKSELIKKEIDDGTRGNSLIGLMHGNEATKPAMTNVNKMT